ncbi:CMD domain protein [Pseudoroseomonas deserti]|uniref:CMD domain protein n=1 Tax=Teichococcus deserti TaxID=1817963 RepID=A0A1V2GXH1_9PROT|nr:CMD domain protein [Pseudoroseomonas deserti]ONG49411.1 CMD domain protein [Pseudoroseomonas deserti]
MTDTIDILAGIAPGAALEKIRANRAAARDHAEASHQALLLPQAPGDVSLAERFAVAAFVAALHRAPEAVALYAEGLAQHAGAALAEAVARAAEANAAAGPTGAFPPGPLSAEDSPAPSFALPADVAAALGDKLAAALAYAHFLIFHPRDAAPERFAPLQAAGWTPDGLVTLSQLVAFLAFQIRVAAGLRVLAATP